MNITEIKANKKRFLPLLLLGDEEENMIDRYLARGVLLVGTLQDEPAAVCVYTDESPVTLPFYKACGYQTVGRIPDFFTKNYNHPIFEGERQLRDMVLLEKTL